MPQRGSFRIASRVRAFEATQDPALRRTRRIARLLDSLRLEIESPGLGYQRTTLLDRETLEELLEVDAVRCRLRLDSF